MPFQQGAKYIDAFTTLLQRYRVLQSTLWQGQALLMKLSRLLCGHCEALHAGAEALKKATAVATKEFRDGPGLLGDAEAVSEDEDEEVEEAALEQL